MKTYKLMIAATAALMCLASCSKDEVNNESAKGQRIKMTLGVGSASSSSDDTRAYVDDITATTSNIFWSDGTNGREIDKIKVYSSASTSGDVFTFTGYTNETSKQNAYFTGETTSSKNGYYAIYPSTAGNGFYASVTNKSLEGVEGTLTNVIKVTIPATQTPTIGSFDPRAMAQIGYLPTSTAEAQNTPMDLHNVCAFLYINLCEGCTSVEVSDNNTVHSYGMTGTVYVSADANATSIDGTYGWVSRDPVVTLKNSDNSQITAGKYLICVLPSLEYPGLQVTVHHKNGYHKTKTVSTKVGFSVGKLYSLGQILPLEFEDDGTTPKNGWVKD